MAHSSFAAPVKKFHGELEARFGNKAYWGTLGSGDSGTVYKVRNPPGSQNECALKVPNGNARSALKQEFDKARMLPPHENLISYLEIIQEGSVNPGMMGYLPGADSMDLDFAPSLPTPPAHKPSFAVLLEYAAGGSLQERLVKGPISEEDLQPLIRDVLEGLIHIHRQGYMHLDIKPANIFLGSAHGPAMIGDFGRMTVHKEYQPHGGAEGDSTYLAPEVLGDEVPPIHAPDIFSLGLTLLECATNFELPRSGRNDGYHLFRSDACPESYLSSLSIDLQQMLSKMLRKNPYERPTAEELLLEPWFADLPPTPAQPKRKSRSTSSPSTPFMMSSTSYAIASSAPSHHYMQSSRFSLGQTAIRFGGNPAATSSAPAVLDDRPVCRRINFNSD